MIRRSGVKLLTWICLHGTRALTTTTDRHLSGSTSWIWPRTTTTQERVRWVGGVAFPCKLNGFFSIAVFLSGIKRSHNKPNQTKMYKTPHHTTPNPPWYHHHDNPCITFLSNTSDHTTGLFVFSSSQARGTKPTTAVSSLPPQTQNFPGDTRSTLASGSCL